MRYQPGYATTVVIMAAIINCLRAIEEMESFILSGGCFFQNSILCRRLHSWPRSSVSSGSGTAEQPILYTVHSFGYAQDRRPFSVSQSCSSPSTAKVVTIGDSVKEGYTYASTDRTGSGIQFLGKAPPALLNPHMSRLAHPKFHGVAGCGNNPDTIGCPVALVLP